MGKFLFLILFILFSFGVNGQVPSIKGQDDTTKMYPVNYEVSGKKAIKLNSTTVLIDTDQDNLLINGGFEAQDVTLGWVKSVNTSIDFIDTGAFEGKKSRAIRFGGTVANYRAEANRPEYVGRQARAEIYYKSDITWSTNIPEICVYAGTASNVVSGTCEPLKNTGTQWYPYQKGFFWSEAVMGLVIRNNGAIDLLNSVYLDKASIKLDKNEGFVANIEGDWHQLSAYDISGGAINLATGTTKSNATLFTVSGNTLTALRPIVVSVSNYISGTSSAASSYVNARILLASTVIAHDENVAYSASIGMRANAAVTRTLSQGESISLLVAGAGSNIVNGYSIYATARSQVTVFPDETFSTDINPVYWKATACLETEIGCYNTYPYAATTNDKGVICSTRPTQTDADIRVNGPILYTRLYNQAGTCNQPVHYEFILPKGLAIPSVDVFKSAGKVDQGMSEYAVDNSGAASGILFKEYNKTTGRFILSNGVVISGNIANRGYLFAGAVRQAHAYTPFSASKTGLGMANVPARYPVKFIESGSNWATVYNDGWVEQYVAGASQSVSGGSNLTQQINLLVLSKSTVATCVPLRNNVGDQAIVLSNATLASTSQVTVALRHTGTVASSPTPAARCESYGASSVVKQYGARPSY